MGEAYPELPAAREKVEAVVQSEEVAFGRTLDHGIELFEDMAERADGEGRSEVRGDEAFKLYDTYGFPLDLTQLMADEKGLTVDLAGFETEMAQQRARSRNGGKKTEQAGTAFSGESTAGGNLAAEHPTEFVGDEILTVDTTRVEAYENGSVVLTSTPFYGESGRAGGRHRLAGDEGGRSDRRAGHHAGRRHNNPPLRS